MSRLVAALWLGLALAGCGRAGPPVRRQPAPPPSPPAAAAEVPEPDAEEEEP